MNSTDIRLFSIQARPLIDQSLRYFLLLIDYPCHFLDHELGFQGLKANSLPKFIYFDPLKGAIKSQLVKVALGMLGVVG
jgi:hypothetical protein